LNCHYQLNQHESHRGRMTVGLTTTYVISVYHH